QTCALPISGVAAVAHHTGARDGSPNNRSRRPPGGRGGRSTPAGAAGRGGAGRSDGRRVGAAAAAGHATAGRSAIMAGIEDPDRTTPTRSTPDRAGAGPGEDAGGRPAEPTATAAWSASRVRALSRRTLRAGRGWAHDLVHEWQDDRVGGLAA